MIRYNNDYVEVEVSDLNDIKCKKSLMICTMTKNWVNKIDM